LRTAPVVVLVVLVLAPGTSLAEGAAEAAPTPAPAASPPAAAGPREARPYCSGEYADDLAALSPRAREFEEAQKRFTFCIRTAAVYECPYYASDGSLRRVRKPVVAHGTGFGYRKDGNDTLVVTNQHVSDWPAVTDDAHPVEGVPSGCKRVSDTLRIVDNEADAYARDDVPLARVVTDPQLDLAVLKAKGPLPVLPWKVGRSAALRERNAVDVRGFPLGVLRTNNVGKVTSAYQHDDDHEWNHDDFVIDALLSPGNSGSPVFAVSCGTGEFELVGVYHAGYVHGSAINVVVGIDQARDLLDALKRTPRARGDAASPLNAATRARVDDALRGGPAAFFPFGATTAAVSHRADGALVLQVMGRDFPVRPQPVLVLEDLPALDEGFGRIGRVWAGNGSGLRSLDRAALDADQQALLARLVDALRRDVVLATSFAAAVRTGAGTRERFDRTARLERALRKLADARQDLAQGALDLADRQCPADAETPFLLSDALFVPPPASAVPALLPPAPADGAAAAAATAAAPRAPAAEAPGPGPR
jgi:serine protease Do